MFSYNINSMDGQTKGEEFMINSELLQKPLGGLEKALFDMAKETINKVVDTDNAKNVDIVRTYIDMTVLAHLQPEDYLADRPKFRGEYLFKLKLLDSADREVVSCAVSEGLSKLDIKITCCLENDYSSKIRVSCLENADLPKIQVLHPAENIRNSLLDMLSLIHGKGKEIFIYFPDILTDNDRIMFYEVNIRARINTAKKPDKLDIEVYNDTPVFGKFVYDNGRSEIIITYDLGVTGYLFLFL